MKRGHRFLIAALVTAVLAAALALLAAGGEGALAEGAIIFVDADSTGEALDGTSWEEAFLDLHEALAVAESGDQIWVAAGTYKPREEVGGIGDRYKTFQLINGVALYGGFDPDTGDTEWVERDWVNNVTILSGDIGIAGTASDNSYHVFYHPAGTNLDDTAILDGFTITGGNAAGGGGGMINYFSSPTLTNVIFEDNQATDGGGMANWASSPALHNCAFSGNEAEYGGGMSNWDGSSPVLTDSTFWANRAQQRGGGMYNLDGSTPTLTNCAFKGNQTWDGDGGGIYNQSSSPALSGCIFEGNFAEYNGGGVYNEHSSPTLANCAFAGNVASDGQGGGMFNYSSSPTLTNCTFWSNSADGGGGMHSDNSTPTLTNCILWSNSPDQISLELSTAVVNFSDVHGGYPGENNLASDPLFVDPGNGDFHLGPGSPCIDAGSNAAPSLPTHDFEGDARVADGDVNGVATADMGIDEALPQSVFLPLVVRSY